MQNAALKRARESAGRGAQWLLALLQDGGSLRGAPPLDAYYKTPCALLGSGHPKEADSVLDFVAARFLRPDGDLDGSGVPWFEQFRIYPHAWLACGALQLGRHDVADLLAQFLRSRWNEESGGFRADAEGAEEIMTTSMAGLACLWAGQHDVARGVAAWLERVMSAQPDLHRGLYHVWKPGAGLVEGDRSVRYFVDASEPRQWYFQYGISAAFLSQYSLRENDTPSLELARKYLHASAHCREDVYRRPQSGKIGWGAAWTFASSHSPADASLMEKVIKGLCSLQCGDGSWNAEGVYEAQPSADAGPRIDVTSEFVALLSFMEKTPGV
jgi:hypothetical protein